MKLTQATYQRPVYTAGGGWLRDEPVEIEAECEAFGDDVVVIWTDACLASLAALDLSGDELVGCEEAMIAAFDSSEREECRLASVRQRVGSSEVAA